MENKSFYLFAGVNRVGKTTLFNAINGDMKKSVRINSDEIVREIGKWNSEIDSSTTGTTAQKTPNNTPILEKAAYVPS